VDCAAKAEPLGRKAVQMIEDANEGVRRGRLAGVDLAADQVERPLEAAPDPLSGYPIRR
jgi:hypothetical protein